MVIQVTWHPEFGYPTSVYIDQSRMIADEEQWWTIESLELLPEPVPAALPSGLLR